MNSVTNAENIKPIFDPIQTFMNDYVIGVLGINRVQWSVSDSVEAKAYSDLVIGKDLSAEDYQMLSKILQAMGWQSETLVLPEIPGDFSGRILNLCTEIFSDELVVQGERVVANVGSLAQMKADPQVKRQSWNLMKKLSAYNF